MAIFNEITTLQLSHNSHKFIFKVRGNAALKNYRKYLTIRNKTKENI